VPNPDRPFLGPHLTRRADGGLEIGPGARLAWSRSGRGFRAREALAQVGAPGVLGMAAGLARRRTGESWRASGARGLGAAARTLVPTLGVIDLADRRTGVRACAVRRDGTIADEFLMVDGPRAVHIIGLPATASTAALALADAAIDRLGRILE
jgi:L-2-hydroxyglutarate oxidase